MAARAKHAATRRERRVHLRVLGQEREIQLEVGAGRSPLLGLLRPARALLSAVADAAVAHARAQGESVSCKAGCNACCHHLVPISAIEAQSLADVVARMDEPRRTRVRARFAAAVRRMEEVAILDPHEPAGRTALRAAPVSGETPWKTASRRYFDAGIPCPFLESERCGIYADRPLVCREYSVVTPAELCSTLNAEVRTVARPVDLTMALVEVAQAMTEIAPLHAMPLTLALEWSAVHGSALKQAGAAGMDLLDALLESLGGSEASLDLDDDRV